MIGICLLVFLTVVSAQLQSLPTDVAVCQRYAADFTTRYGPQRFSNVVAVSPGVDPVRCHAAQVVEEPFLNDALRRLSFIRWLTGLQDVSLNREAQQQYQQCALMMAMNGNAKSPYYHPSDDPHTDHDQWLCRDPPSTRTAASQGNIYYGQSVSGLQFEWQTTPADILAAFVDDYGSWKQGHRQSILCPNLAYATFGHVCFYDDVTQRHFCGGCQAALQRDTKSMTPRGYIAWPPAGYVPHQLVSAHIYWSFAVMLRPSQAGSVTVFVNRQPLADVQRVPALCDGRGIGQSDAQQWQADGTTMQWIRFKPPSDAVEHAVISVRVVWSNDDGGSSSNEWQYTIRRVDCSQITSAPTPSPTPLPPATLSPTPAPTPMPPTPVPTTLATSAPTPPTSLPTTLPPQTSLPTSLPPPTPLPTPLPLPTNKTPTTYLDTSSSTTFETASLVSTTTVDLNSASLSTMSSRPTSLLSPSYEEEEEDETDWAFALFILLCVVGGLFYLAAMWRFLRKTLQKDEEIEMDRLERNFERAERAAVLARARRVLNASHNNVDDEPPSRASSTRN